MGLASFGREFDWKIVTQLTTGGVALAGGVAAVALGEILGVVFAIEQNTRAAAEALRGQGASGNRADAGAQFLQPQHG